MAISKKYKTRHLILENLFNKLKYNDAHFFNLLESATSVEQLATELDETVEEILTAHHGLTKHITCNCSSGKHIITLNADGIDAYIDEYWLREGQKDLNDKFYDRIKWIVPVAVLLVTSISLGYNAYKTSNALSKVDNVKVEVEIVRRSIEIINSKISTADSALIMLEIFKSQIKSLQKKIDPSTKAKKANPKFR